MRERARGSEQISVLSEPICLLPNVHYHLRTHALVHHFWWFTKTSGAGGGWGVSALSLLLPKLLLCVVKFPLLKYVELVTFSLIKRWLNDASFVQRNECCKRSGFMQGNDSHRGGIWCLLSKSLNVSDPDVNAWPPECVVHDIDPLQLLEPDCSHPMISVAGICIGDVEIYSSQLLHLNFHWLLKCFCFLPTNLFQRAAIFHH